MKLSTISSIFSLSSMIFPSSINIASHSEFQLDCKKHISSEAAVRLEVKLSCHHMYIYQITPGVTIAEERVPRTPGDKLVDSLK